MDASLNESMLLDVKVSIKRERVGKKGQKADDAYTTTYLVVGNLPMEEFKVLLKTTKERELNLRTEFGQIKVSFESLDYKVDGGEFTLILSEQ